MSGARDPSEPTVGVGPSAPAPSDLKRGATVGRYVILDPLGAGGMGVVYKAYDPDLDRTVALKLMNLSNDPHAVRHRERLLREAQALAKLSHPNVIAVYDVGEFGELVFIATEYVDGQTLRTWLKQQPRSMREVLDAFLAAGEGLAAAHRAGLVHRDFKPDNVMIDKEGRVRVLDFGLVRVEGDAANAAAQRSPSEVSESGKGWVSQLTYEGAIMGTPMFMSPEQHLGHPADARADQFSFCVSLYEALYGSHPFIGRHEVVNGRVSEPPAGTRVPRWLRQVLLTGLALKPEARHASMAALLAALRADPRVARGRRLRAVGLLAVIGLGALAWRLESRRELVACQGAGRKLKGVWDEARRAAVRSAFLGSGKPYAQAVLGTVERAFDDYARAWSTMHVDACEATRLRGEQSQELLDLRMACLSERLTQLGALVDQYTRADGAAVERAASSVQSLPGLDACADTAALRAPVPPPGDEQTRGRVEKVREQLARANALNLAARFDEALRVGRAALDYAQTLKYSPALAEAQLRMGQIYGEMGEYGESARAYHQALIAALAGHHDEVAARAATYLISAVGDRLAHYEEGDHWAGVAEALVGRLQRRDELLGALYTKRATLRWRESKYDEALDEATRALELERRALGPDHLAVAETYNLLAELYYRKARYAEALDNFQRSFEIRQRLLGPSHPRLSAIQIGMADVYGDSGQHERALATYLQAMDTLLRAQPDHPDLPLIYTGMGGEYLALGRPREAFEQFQRAYEIWEKKLGPSEQTTSALYNLGDARLHMEKPDEALRYFTQALDMCEHALPPGHSFCGAVLDGLGEAHERLGHLADALGYLRRAVELSEKALGAKHPQLVRPLLGIARVQMARHAPAQATAPLERALSIREAYPGERNEVAEIRAALAQASAQSRRR
jgi:tetratricopeptide (TPR) repeat protein